MSLDILLPAQSASASASAAPAPAPAPPAAAAAAAGPPPADPIRSSSWIGFPTARRAMDHGKFTPLSELYRVPHNFYVNVLVILVGPRVDSRATRKKDWYVVDVSSLTANGQRRRTVLSLWRDQDTFEREAVPGSVLAAYGVGVNKNYEEDVVHSVLRMVPNKVLHGHLNVYHSNPGNWYELDPKTVGGYVELVEWRDTVLEGEHRVLREAEGRERQKDEEERIRLDREEAEMAKRHKIEEEQNLSEAEKARRERVLEQEEEEELARMEKEGMIWWRDGKPFWKIDGLY